MFIAKGITIYLGSYVFMNSYPYEETCALL